MMASVEPTVVFDQCAGLSAATTLGLLLLIADSRTREDSSAAALTTLAVLPGAGWCIEHSMTGCGSTALEPLWCFGVFLGLLALPASFAIHPPPEASAANNMVRVLGVWAWASAVNLAAISVASI